MCALGKLNGETRHRLIIAGFSNIKSDYSYDSECDWHVNSDGTECVLCDWIHCKYIFVFLFLCCCYYKMNKFH